MLDNLPIGDAEDGHARRLICCDCVRRLGKVDSIDIVKMKWMLPCCRPLVVAGCAWVSKSKSRRLASMPKTMSWVQPTQSPAPKSGCCGRRRITRASAGCFSVCWLSIGTTPLQLLSFWITSGSIKPKRSRHCSATSRSSFACISCRLIHRNSIRSNGSGGTFAKTSLTMCS